MITLQTHSPRKKGFVGLYMYESYIFISRVIDSNFSSFTRSEDNCSSIILSSVVYCFVIQLLRSFKEILAVLPFPANTCLSHSVFLHFNVSSKTCLSSCSLLSDSFSVWHSVLISSNSRWATASSSQCLLMDCTCRSSNLCASFNDCINFFTTKQGKKKKKVTLWKLKMTNGSSHSTIDLPHMQKFLMKDGL